MNELLHRFKLGNDAELLLEKRGGGFEKVATVPVGSQALGVTQSSGGVVIDTPTGKAVIQTSALAFSPADFAPSVPLLAIWDATDISTLYLDAAGTLPAYQPGAGLADPKILHMKDKSGRGFAATQSVSGSAPTLSARYNILSGTGALATQTVTTVASDYKLSFSGAGSVTLSGTATGTYSAGTNTITCTAGSLTVTVSGAVNFADLRLAGTQAGIPAYQRVFDANTYDYVGFPCRLRGSGSQFMRFDVSLIGTDTPIEMITAVGLSAPGSTPAALSGDSNSQGPILVLGSATDRKFKVLAGGGSGAKNAITPAAGTPCGQIDVLGLHYNGIELHGTRNGVTEMAVARSGNYGAVTEGRIVNTVGLVSPVDFYGAVIARTELSASDRAAVGGYLAGRAKVSYSGPTYGTPEGIIFAIGDSTVSDYPSTPAGSNILSLITTTRMRKSLADPGDTIAEQRLVWATAPGKDKAYAVIIQLGLNECVLPKTGAQIIAEMQSFIDLIRSEVPSSCTILISKMTPCNARWDIVVGAGAAAADAQARWEALNDAIAGAGSTPITGVHWRVTSHVPLLDDGSGNLAAAYDTGDKIHPNNTGRQIYADAWENAMLAAGLTL